MTVRMGGVHLLAQSLTRGRTTMLEPTLTSDGASSAVGRRSDAHSCRIPDDVSHVILQKDSTAFFLASPKRAPPQITAMTPTQVNSHIAPRHQTPPDHDPLEPLQGSPMPRQFPPEAITPGPKRAHFVCSETTAVRRWSSADQERPDNTSRMQPTAPAPSGCGSCRPTGSTYCSSSNTSAADHDLPPLPPGTRPLSHQVAGHVYGKSSSKLGMLECVDGTLLKPLPGGRCGHSELAFYETVWSTNVLGTANGPHSLCKKYKDCEIANVEVMSRTENKRSLLRSSDKDISTVDDSNTSSTAVLLEARKFVPTYLGTYVDPSHPEVTYLRLVDLARTFRRPCIADIKVGAQSYDPDATAEKIAKERAKYPPQEKLHFQLKGMRHYCRTTDLFTTCTKEFLRGLDESQVLTKGFGRFFDNDTGTRCDVISTCLYKLLEIRSWVEKQRKYAFYASSILIIYEGDVPCFNCRFKDLNIRTDLSPNTLLLRDISEEVEGESAHVEATPQQRPCVSDVFVDKNYSVNLRSKTIEPGVGNKPNNDWHPAGSATNAGKDGGAVESLLCRTIDTTGDDDSSVASVCSCSKVEVKMIDFARVFPSDGVDMNYLEGLNSLMAHLQMLLPDNTGTETQSLDHRDPLSTTE